MERTSDVVEEGARIDAYRLEALLGQGGMACVYRARHERLGSLHAIKFLHAEFARHAEVRERFLNEGRIQAQLRHPALVQVTDLIEDGADVGLVMEYVEGESLDAVLRASGPLDLALVREVFLQVASGLAYVHGKGIVHRDLKPSNIMVEASERGVRARLLDFGVAKFDAPGNAALTRTGMTIGTLQYMSPEQVRGEAVDGRSDLFALGSVLYEVLSGKAAFTASSAFALQMAIVQNEVADLAELRPDLPDELHAVVRRLLAKEPGDRYPSADAFARAFEQVTRAEGSAAWVAPFAVSPTTPPPVRPKTPPASDPLDEANDIELAFRPGRRRMRLLVGVLLATSLAGGFYFLRDRKQEHARGGRLDEVVRATERIDAASGLAFLRLPGGRFRFGCELGDKHCEPDEPKAEPTLVRGFWMGKTPVTVGAWERCVEAGACDAKVRRVTNRQGEHCNASDDAKKHHPINCLTLDEAKALCRFAGGRLPTAVEWEYAAKTGGRFLAPWGNADPTPEHAHFADSRRDEERTAEVGRHLKGTSPWGLVDLAGNVWEVTATPSDERRVSYEARGGSFKSVSRSLRASARKYVDPSERVDSVGVRCAFDDPTSD